MLVLNLSFKACLFLLSLGLALISSAEGISAGDIQMSNLRDNSRMSIRHELGAFGIAVMFQPKCPWCKKQIKDLDSIRHLCNLKTPSMLLGINGTKRELKRELRTLDTEQSALLASTQFLRQTKVEAVAPTTLFFNEAGEVIHRHRGYIPKAKLSQILAGIENTHCDI